MFLSQVSKKMITNTSGPKWCRPFFFLCLECSGNNRSFSKFIGGPICPFSYLPCCFRCWGGPQCLCGTRGRRSSSLLSDTRRLNRSSSRNALQIGRHMGTGTYFSSNKWAEIGRRPWVLLIDGHGVACRPAVVSTRSKWWLFPESRTWFSWWRQHISKQCSFCSRGRVKVLIFHIISWESVWWGVVCKFWRVWLLCRSRSVRSSCRGFQWFLKKEKGHPHQGWSAKCRYRWRGSIVGLQRNQ